MVRRTLLFAAGTLMLALALPSAPASAGGGCHAGATNGAGDTVEMLDACFTPTILTVDPGDTVSFVNRDPMTHNVVGNLWGDAGGLERGDAVSATFEDPGVYPYGCTYHPGMTGAVVVGDGTGVGIGDTVSVDPFEAGGADGVEPVAETDVAGAGGDPQAIGWIVGGALGLAAGLAMGSGRRRAVRDPGGADGDVRR